jgi:hypothetical protein
MNTSLRPALTLLCLVAAAPFVLPEAGCTYGNCTAACVSELRVIGHLELAVGDGVPLAVELCAGNECTTANLVYEGAAPACDDFDLECQLTDAAGGGSTLQLTIRPTSPVLEAGLPVAVYVERTDTGEVLVDAALELMIVTSHETCGTTCNDGVVGWDVFPG